MGIFTTMILIISESDGSHAEHCERRLLLSKKKLMNYKPFVSMNIAIIGQGESTLDYATAFACAGHEVYMAWKGEDKSTMRLLCGVFDNIHDCSVEDAANISDLIIIATAPKDVRETAYWLGDVRRKVIIDATANVNAPDEDFVKTVAGIQAITGSNHIVKVFNTKGYEQLLRPIFGDKKVQLILAGDSRKAKEIARIMAGEIGITACHDFGGNDTIPLFNEMTKCWRNMDTKSIRVKAPVKH